MFVYKKNENKNTSHISQHFFTVPLERWRKEESALFFLVGYCEGCFCDGATCRAKDDHNVDLGLDERESNPKFNRGPNIQPKG